MKVLRELCPQNPAWLDAVNVLFAQPALVINPYRNHLAMTYDGLPQGGPIEHVCVFLGHDRCDTQGGTGNHLRGEDPLLYR